MGAGPHQKSGHRVEGSRAWEEGKKAQAGENVSGPI